MEKNGVCGSHGAKCLWRQASVADFSIMITITMWMKAQHRSTTSNIRKN